MRLIDDKGVMLGIMTAEEALVLAREAGLDLVEVSPNAEPPVCKILDYGKYQYDQQRRDRISKKKAHRVQLKEMRFSLKIGQHDLEVKVARVRGFLEDGNRVQLNLRFRGRREREHPEVGRDVLMRVRNMLEDISTCERQPFMEGRLMTMLLVPNKS